MKRIVGILLVLFVMLNTCAFAETSPSDPSEFGEQLTDVTAEDFHGVWECKYALFHDYIFALEEISELDMTAVMDDGSAAVTQCDPETGEQVAGSEFEVVFADGAYTGAQ